MDQNQYLKDKFLTALDDNRHKLLRLCSVYAEDDDDKKDLFQEATVNIWEAMPSFNGNSEINTWMFRITLNVCLRLQSKQSRKKSQFVRMDSIIIDHDVTEESNPEQQEQLANLRKSIKKLNEADRAIIALYLEELPYKEIAEITGLKENTVAVKVKRIKKKLLDCLTKRS